MKDRAPFVCQPVTAAPKYYEVDAPQRTALREAAYVLRTRFQWGDGEFVDFTKRRADLFMSASIIPEAAGDWAASPYLRWKAADEAADKSGRANEVRAWHVVADLPAGLSKGKWFDEAEQMLRSVLPASAVAELVGHIPSRETPPHVHILVAARCANKRLGYGKVSFCLYRRLNEVLRAMWLHWLAHEAGPSQRLAL